jgi:predicted methyltransferase
MVKQSPTGMRHGLRACLAQEAETAFQLFIHDPRYRANSREKFKSRRVPCPTLVCA